MVQRGWAADLHASTLYRILRLRVDVFVVEQRCPYPELDGRDLEPATRHFWVCGDDEAVIATLRLLEDAPDPHGVTTFRIGRVCTDREHRGRGLTKRLMQAALSEVGDRPCRLDAQTHLTAMYASFGFMVAGREYVEDGIPHVPMHRPGA